VIDGIEMFEMFEMFEEFEEFKMFERVEGFNTSTWFSLLRLRSVTNAHYHPSATSKT